MLGTWKENCKILQQLDSFKMCFHFQTCAFLFKTCFHFRNKLSFLEWAFIFGMNFHFWDVLQFLKLAFIFKMPFKLANHYFFKNTTSPHPISLQFLAHFLLNLQKKKKKNMKRAFLLKYIIFLHLCWCIYFLYFHMVREGWAF